MKSFRKLLCLIGALLMLVSLFALPLSAASTDDKKAEPYTWKVSEDGTVISDPYRTYRQYELPVGYKISFSDKYVYEKTVKLPGHDYARLCANGRGGDYLYFLYGEGDVVYTAESGMASLRAFVEEGKYHFVRLKDDNYYVDVDLAYLEALDGLSFSDAKEVAVQELKSAPCYDVCVYDESDNFEYTYGAIYFYAGEFCYMNYRNLPNQYFDAEGNFSYRQGSVSIIPIREEELRAEAVYFAENSYWRNVEQRWERDEFSREDPSTITFWLVYVLSMLLLPAFLLIFSLIRAARKRKGKGSYRYWYLIAALAAVWLILGGVVLLLLLI